MQDSEDEGQTDQSDSEVEEDEDDEASDCISAGDIVWGMCGRIWYPARVCSLNDLPKNLIKKFRNTRSKVIVKWYGKHSYSLLNISKIDRLAQNKIDGCRASKSEQMQKLYNEALADLYE